MQLNVKTVLFQTIQFRISTQLSSIWSIDRTLPLQTRVDLGMMAMKGYSTLSFSITGASPSDCLVSYPGDVFGESYPSAAMQSEYFTAPSDCANLEWLQLYFPFVYFNIDYLVNWLHVNLSGVILYLEVREQWSLYIYIYIFLCHCFLRVSFFFLHAYMLSSIPIKYK